MLGVSNYTTFCLTVTMFMAIPGPGTFCLLTSTSQGGLRAGLVSMLGILTGDQVLLWLTVAGLTGLLATHPAFLDVLRWLGVAYLLWVGVSLFWATARSASETPAVQKAQPASFYRRGLLITLLNPKAMLFYFAFFPLFIDPKTYQGAPTLLLMSLSIGGLSFVYSSLLCVCSAKIGQQLKQSAKAQRLFQQIMGLALLGFGLNLLLSPQGFMGSA